MIRKLVDRYFDEDTKYSEMFGLSTDSKPTAGLVTGSKFTEVDTGDVYLYDEVGKSWAKVTAGYVAPDESEPAADADNNG